MDLSFLVEAIILMEYVKVTITSENSNFTYEIPECRVESYCNGIYLEGNSKNTLTININDIKNISYDTYDNMYEILFVNGVQASIEFN